jgi:hypothetical protein
MIFLFALVEVDVNCDDFSCEFELRWTSVSGQKRFEL